MNERLVTAAGAVGALALFLGMFLQGGAREGRDEVPRPTSAEQRGNGYRAAFEWLEREHIRVVTSRDRFDKLSNFPGVPVSGNLLLVTLPAATAFRTDEFRALDHWVRAGNTLLVLAALADAPDWAFELGRPATGDLTLLTGLEAVAVRGPAGQSHVKTVVPNLPHAYFDGVGTVAALSDHPAHPWTVRVPYDGFALALAREGESGTEVLWTRALGNGRVIVSGVGTLFTNRAFGLAGNARLLANIVGATVAPGGAVLFDDLHQGLGSAYDPARFYSDPRLYETVGILAALWLCWIFGATPLRVPEVRSSGPHEAELVQVTGDFLARVVTPAAAAQRLFGNCFRRVAAHLPSSGEKGPPPWELIARHPGISASDLSQLQDWYGDACAGRRVPLGRLHNLLRKIDTHRVT